MHTPGPWKFEPHSGFGAKDPDGNDCPFGYISTKHPSPIFELRPLLVFPPGELIADAMIMAAAPKLLEKLKKVAGWLDRQATANEAQAKDTRFPSMAEAYRADAKNYRDTIANIMTVVDEAEGRA